MSRYEHENTSFEEEIPPQCRDCGVQCAIGRHIDGLKKSKMAGNEIGVAILGDTENGIDIMMVPEPPEEVADELRATLGKKVAETLDDIDDEIERAQDEIAANALACSGVLKIRARRDGKTYTVGLCTSARVYVMGNGPPNHVPAHIWVDSENL